MLMDYMEHNEPYFCVLKGIFVRRDQKKSLILWKRTNSNQFRSKKPVFAFKRQGKAQKKKFFLPESLFLCITSTFGWEKNIWGQNWFSTHPTVQALLLS